MLLELTNRMALKISPEQDSDIIFRWCPENIGRFRENALHVQDSKFIEQWNIKTSSINLKR
jgi:hypothetical protein